MSEFGTRRRVVEASILLVLVVGIGGYIGARGYVGENADAVSIVVNGSIFVFVANGDVTNGGGTLIPAGPPIKPVERFHYTGSLAREIQRTINTYHDPEGRVTPECNPDTSQIYAYSYALTFTLNGVVVESATGGSQDCSWRLSILGFPSILADNDRILPGQLHALSNDQIPEPQAPDYA